MPDRTITCKGMHHTAKAARGPMTQPASQNEPESSLRPLEAVFDCRRAVRPSERRHQSALPTSSGRCRSSSNPRQAERDRRAIRRLRAPPTRQSQNVLESNAKGAPTRARAPSAPGINEPVRAALSLSRMIIWRFSRFPRRYSRLLSRQSCKTSASGTSSSV